MKLGSLCTGAGMFDLAATELLGAHTAWCAENDPDAAKVCVERLQTPNLGDITEVDWRRVEPVDVLAAGYPCQDLSNAGKRAGIEGAKSGIWRNVADAVRVLRPRLVLLENVRGHLARGFGRVLGDLAELGYDASWTCLRASDVGACHQRDRVFILAAPSHPDSERVRIEPVPVGARGSEAEPGGDREELLMPTPTANLARGSGMPSPALAAIRMAEGRRFLDDAVALLPTPAARVSSRGSGYGDEPGRPLSETITRLLPTPRASDSDKAGPNQRGSSGDLALMSAVALLPTPTATDAKGGRNATAGRTKPPGARTNHDGWTLSDVAYADRWGMYGPAIRRQEAVFGCPAPEPTVTGKRGGQRLSGRFVEWMMGWPDGWVTDLVDNKAALRIGGNGLVPQQAIAAFRSLSREVP